MPRESSLWATVRDEIGPHGDLVRIENTLEDGTPDVNYCLRYQNRVAEGWIELKQRGAWPTRGGLVTFAHLTAAQEAWVVRRSQAAGRVFLLCRVGDAHTLHRGGDAIASVRRGLDASAFIASASVYEPSGFPTARLLAALCS